MATRRPPTVDACRRIGCLGLLLTALIAEEPAAVEPYIGLRLLYLQPANSAPSYVLVDADNDNVPEGTYRNLARGRSASIALRGGLRLPSEERVELSAWHAAFEDEETVRAPAGGALWDVLYDPSYSSEDTSASSATADGRIDAWYIDLAWVQPLLRPTEASPLGVAVSVGLRRAELTDDLAVDYPNDRRIEHHSAVHGWGLRLGAEMERRFLAGRLGFNASASYTLCRGELETADVQSQTAWSIEEDTRSITDHTFSIVEISAGIDIRIWRGLGAHIGYAFSLWQQATRFDTFVDDVDESKRSHNLRDVSFDGFVAGIGWEQSF